MADQGGSLSTQVVVSGGFVQVTMGDVSVSVPIAQIDAFVQVLQAARLLAAVAPAGAPGATPTPVAVPVPVPVPEPEPVAAATTGAAPAAPTEAPPSAAKVRKKRRSRKRVGDALVVWLKDNPGWHSEEALLEAVVNHKMTDASPKRALMIALGKQRDELFEGDGKGHWKLVSDSEAGPPPKVKPRPKAAPSGSKARSSRARARRTTDTAGQDRSRRRIKLKTRPRTAPGVDDKAASPRSAEAKTAEAKTAEVKTAEVKTAEPTAEGTKVVRVRKGEDRKLAALPPAERKARKDGPAKAAGRAGGRWGSVSREEVERARRNLLGLGGTSRTVDDSKAD